MTQAVLQAPAAAEPKPTLAPSESPPPEQTYQEAEKPAPAEPPLQPEPQDDQADESATNLQAPELFNPSDRTAQSHAAPVWTAVYHKTAASAQLPAQNISWQQAELDAEGWTSASE